MQAHKRKNPMPTACGASEGQSRLNLIQPNYTQRQGQNKAMQNQAPVIHKRKNPMNKATQSSLPITKIIPQAEVEDQPAIEEQHGLKKAKRKPIHQAMSLDQFLEKQGIHVEGEKQPDIQPMDDFGGNNIQSIDDFGGNNMSSDDDDAVDHAVGHNDFVVDQVMDIDHVEGGTMEKKKTRGKTTCKSIHARTMEEREEVTFDKGQAVGPTNKRVSDLSNFLGTIARNPRFITLLYTNWIAMPKENKKCMWNYVNSKFIVPNDAKKWVMATIRDAWKRHKRKIKKKHFDKYDTIEDMLKNRPVDIPEVTFTKLINYWSLPIVQSMCQMNSVNRKKQKSGHRMGPVNFGIVCMRLRSTKENNEDPTKSEMFVVIRTNSKGKEVDSETKAAISELQNRQEAGETDEGAFEVVFGKEHPGRVRCYGRSVTATYLKKDEEINIIKRQHNEKVESLQTEVGDLKGEVKGLRHIVKILLQQNNPGMSAEEVEALLQSTQHSAPDANSAQGVVGHHLPRSSGSTHVSNLEMDNIGTAFGDDDRTTYI